MNIQMIVLGIVLTTFVDRIRGFKQDPEIVKEALLESTALIKYYGYQAENHTVNTKDGYQLTMHRIPGYKNSLYNKYGIPVLLMHGMNTKSMTWFHSGPNSFAFLLVDKGYDVWMGNYRGNLFTTHNRWTRKQKEFWDYTFDDHAMEDLPKMIDYVLEISGYEKLIHVGQSLGTTISFASFSDTDKYNNKIAGNIAFGPTLSTTYQTAPLHRILRIIAKHTDVMRTIGMYSWMEVSDSTTKHTLTACPSDNPIICQLSMSFFNGHDPYLPNKTRIPIYAVQSTSGVSLNLVNIFLQLRSGHLSKFDHGYSKNMALYNSTIPPEYNFSRNCVPTVLFYGANDGATDPLDVLLSSRILSNVIGMELVPNPFFAHGDYTWATNAKELVYDKALQYMEVWAHSF